jgi:hypothetical protein
VEAAGTKYFLAAREAWWPWEKKGRQRAARAVRVAGQDGAVVGRGYAHLPSGRPSQPNFPEKLQQTLRTGLRYLADGAGVSLGAIWVFMLSLGSAEASCAVISRTENFQVFHSTT